MYVTNASIVPAALAGKNLATRTGNFSTGSYGESFTRYGAPYTGYLPKPWARALDEAFNLGQVSQVIYSYSTPIAWKDARYGWIIPRVTYSATTGTRHQSQLWQLGGRHIYVPYDATQEDMRRVLEGVMHFDGERGTRPGPNFVLN